MTAARLIALAAALSGCMGYSHAEMQVKKDRIDQLTRRLEEQEALLDRMEERCKELIGEAYEEARRMVRSGAPSPTAEAAPGAGAGSEPAVFSVDGQGIATTRPFTVAGPWEAVFMVVESEGANNFVALHAATGELVGVFIQRQGDGSSTAFHPRPGSYYFAVNAGGAWRIKVLPAR